MRVAIVSPEFPPEVGGIQTYAWEFTKELLSRGHEVTVFTRPHPEGEAELGGSAQVNPLLRLRRPLDSAVLSQHQAEVWHVMNAAYAWLSLEGKNTIVSVHGNDFLRPYLPMAMPDFSGWHGGWRLAGREPAWLWRVALSRTASLVRKALPRARHIIANSHYTEQTLLQQNPACAGSTSAAWPGVSPRFFETRRRPAKDGVKRLLTVCRLGEPRKNVDMVLRALATLKHKAFRYTIVGDGHDRKRLEALAHELGLSECVHFTGFIADQALLDAYAESDLMVMASSIVPGSHEGFGIVYVEAGGERRTQSGRAAGGRGRGGGGWCCLAASSKSPASRASPAAWSSSWPARSPSIRRRAAPSRAASATSTWSIMRYSHYGPDHGVKHVPLVSVVMPCFNARPYLREAVEQRTWPAVSATSN